MKSLHWAGWYPMNEQDHYGNFIKNHIKVISSFSECKVFSIRPERRICCMKRKKYFENSSEITIYLIPDFLPFRVFFYFLIPLWEAYLAKRKFKHIPVFHLHVSFPFALFCLPLFCIFRFPRRYLTEHCSSYLPANGEFQKLPQILQKMFSYSIRKFHKVSAVSESFSLHLKNLFHLKKVYLTYNVINFPDNKSTMSTPHPIPPFRLITSGNLLDAHKNISTLIKIIKLFSEKYSFVTLDIYGDGKDKTFLQNLAASLNILNKNIFFRDPYPEGTWMHVFPHYHIFILMSRYETFSLVTAEALFCGIPVVVSPSGGPENYVQNGIHGFVVSPENPQDVCDKLEYILHHYTLFWENIRNHPIHPLFTTESNRKQWLEFYG